MDHSPRIPGAGAGWHWHASRRVMVFVSAMLLFTGILLAWVALHLYLAALV